MRELDWLVGRTLGRYQVEALLGQGGMSAVYTATDPAFGRVVAIKVLKPGVAQDPQLNARFLREARAMARLQHPHILPVYDVGEQDGLAYLVMPFVDGGTFRERLRGARGALPPDEIVALLRPVAQALDFAHRQGIIHRDVKPTNILLTAQDYPLLADFGIAKVLGEQYAGAMTATGLVVGTPEYISPEQGQGLALDGRSDLYSLGVLLYQAFTGRTPFRAEGPADTPISIIVRHVSSPPPPPHAVNPAISPAVEAVLLGALAKDPNDRYPTGAALFAALGEALATAETSALRMAGGVGRPHEAPPERTPTPVPTPIPAGLPALGVAGATPAVAGSGPWGRLSRAQRIGCGVLAVLLLLSTLGGAVALASRGGRATPGTETASTPAATAVVAGPPVAAATATPIVTATAPPEPTATSAATPTPSAVAATATAPVVASPGGAATPTGVAGQGGQAGQGGKREVILFASHRGDVHDSQIYTMNPDGSDQRQLTFSRGHSWGPRLSPDGQYFVFSSVAPGEHVDHSATGGGTAGSGHHEIYLAKSDGSEIVRLTDTTAWNNAWSWSPDSKVITFTSDRDGNWEIYRMDLKGQQVARLTENPAQDGWPSWTPDGRQIVFASDRETPGSSQIYVMDAAGGNARRLTRSGTYDTFPTVSPDGKKIVYSVQVPSANEGEIYVMNLDGSGVTRLTSTVALNTEPSWSPDGTKILFVSDRDGNSNVYTMDADGKNQRRLTSDPGEDVTPYWGIVTTPARSSSPDPQSDSRAVGQSGRYPSPLTAALPGGVATRAGGRRRPLAQSAPRGR